VAQSRRRFDADPHTVFDHLTDAEQYPRWLVGAKFVRITDPRWPRPGSTFDHEVGAGPVSVDDRTTVTGNDRDHHFDLVVRARPFLEADVHFELAPDGTGTQLMMRETPRGVFRALAPLIAPFVRVRNDRSLRNLAELVDGRSH
jgi:uncharacterized protein YndB with AHSA1/START domain